MRSLSSARIRIIIALVALALFAPALGAVHLFDWDEINFAEIAREMLSTGDWLRPRIDFHPFYEKPPLFIWMQALSMKALGVNEYAARLPNALCGVLTLLVIFRIGERLRSKRFGLLWVLAYVGSILPHLYFRSGIIDPWFNLFIFLALHAFIRSARESSSRQALLSGAFVGLAVLTKGPAALIILGLTFGVYWALRKFRPFFRVAHVLVLILTFLVVVALWFGVDYIRNGPAFTIAFFERQVALFTEEDAGHGGFFGYHFVIMLIGCFPASLFAIAEMAKRSSTQDSERDYRKWMLVLFWVVLILFSIVKTKIVHYSSLCYFPLTFLAALKLEQLWNGEVKAPMWVRIPIGIVGNLFVLATLALPWLGMHAEELKPFLTADPFAQGNLEATVHWSGWEMFAGIWLFGVLGIAHLFFQRERYRPGIITLFGGSALFVTITLFLFINRIEGYSQRAAIDFFQARRNERCHVHTVGYKSYAHYFYARTTEATPDETVLYHGVIDRPVYLSCKVTSVDEVLAIGTFREIGRVNGFVFWRRDP